MGSLKHISDSVALGKPENGISNKFLGDTEALFQGPHFENHSTEGIRPSTGPVTALAKKKK